MPSEPPAPRPAAPSLAARVVAALAAGDTGHDTRAGIAVTLLLAAAPLAVWAGARWTEAGVRRDIGAIRATAAPRLAILDARTAARAELDPLLSVPGVAATLDGLARALPRDASLSRVARGSDRRLAIDVATADPDRLRAALRRMPATAALRDAGQRRGDGGMTVTLEEAR
jgi:hypothetical protein